MNNEKLHDTMDSLSRLLGYTAPAGEAASVVDDTMKEKILKCWEEKDFCYVSVDELYAEFNAMFGKEAIKNFTDEECLFKLFGMKDDKSLVYYLEHVNKFLYFGKVGGYRTIYTLYEKDNVWKYCTNPRNVRVISVEEAINKAKSYRDGFVALFDAIDGLQSAGALSTKEGFEQLQNELTEKLGTLYNRNWVWKYLHMVYPDLFITVYSTEWVNKIFRVAKLVPERNYLRQCRQLSLYAAELGLKNVYLYHILCHIDDAEEIQDDAPVEKTDDEAPADVEERVIPERAPRVHKIHPLNIILYGAPGTGKTYITAEYASAIIENRKAVPDADWTTIKERYNSYVNSGLIVFTTFHQSYGYEEFISGLQPCNVNGVMEFKPVSGVFKTIAQKAINDTENNYVIIIDEINRANISKVLGELITLIEEDKRWGEEKGLSVELPTRERFTVPNNLYIVGTMNTADKSISLIDTALRRRFKFIEVTPEPSLVQDATLRTVLKRLNDSLVTELESTDLLIGHAYFMGKTADDLCDIMNQSIIPLLYEYYYDNRKKVEQQIKTAIADLPYEIENVPYGRMKIKNKV